MTQIQEVTLSFVPKLIGSAVVAARHRQLDAAPGRVDFTHRPVRPLPALLGRLTGGPMTFQVPVEQVLAVLLAGHAGRRRGCWSRHRSPPGAIPSLVKVALAVAVALPIGPRLSGRYRSPEVVPVVLAALFQVVVGAGAGLPGAADLLGGPGGR